MDEINQIYSKLDFNFGTGPVKMAGPWSGLIKLEKV